MFFKSHRPKRPAMFGVSFFELLLVLLIGFLVLGPERLGQLAAQWGRTLSKFKSELKILKETQFSQFDDSSFYKAETPLNQSLKEISAQPTQEEPKSAK